MPTQTREPRRSALALRALALATLVLAVACVGARPKPLEPGLGPAAVPATAPSPGPDADSLRVFLMTFGPGEAVWEHFGHTALWVHDPIHDTDQAYNYGMFDFNQPHFLRRFVQGKMLYWMQGFDAALFAKVYVDENRSVWLQELALTPAQRAALRDFLVWNERPENRFYPYDYYRDGCSTRVRDALDRVLGGAIRAQTERVPSGSTYRSHSLQLVQDDPWAYTGLSLGLARPTDRPISLWEEMFLPLKLRETLRRVSVPAPDGRMIPLVSSERTYFESMHPPEATLPPERTWKYLLAGVAIAVVMGALGWVARRQRGPVSDDTSRAALTAGSRPAPGEEAARGHAALRRPLAPRVARAALAIVAALWALISGLFGLLLIYLWVFTDHVTSQNNENILQFDALALALVALVPAALYGRRWATRPARWLAAAVAALSLLGFLLKATPWFWQVNAPIIALALPANLALAWALSQATSGTSRVDRRAGATAP